MASKPTWAGSPSRSGARIRSCVRLTTLVALCSCSAADDLAGSEGLSGGDTASVDESSGSRELSLEEQIGVMEQRIEATNTRDWDRWQALHVPNAVRTAPELEQPLRGSDAMRAAIETLSAAFPDYHLELTQAFGQGPWLAVRLHTTGTMTGALLLSDGTRVPPTGQSIEQDWTALVRFEGERIAQFDEFYDQIALMQQLGLLGQ